MLARSLSLLAILLILCGRAGDGAELPASLPLPEIRLPQMPPLLPTVITPGGKRFLLAETDVDVVFDRSRGTLNVNRAGWWVINFPLTAIKGFEGQSANEVARQLFGVDAGKVRNWYIKTPGKSAEPPVSSGPAPIELTPRPSLVVNNSHPAASDSGPATSDAPLRTIPAALKRAGPGAVIHVHPGIYRERIEISQSGTKDRPIRLEGIRDKQGRMPVISGNDPFPTRAWQPVRGLRAVYRADMLGKFIGTVSADGATLIERSIPGELKEGEFCHNRASGEFLNLRMDGNVNPRDGERQDGRSWRLLKTDDAGFLDLGVAYGKDASQAVFWASTYVWVQPRSAPQPGKIVGAVEAGGEFRAARMAGSPLEAQVNAYRMWVNGRLLPAVVYSTAENFEAVLPHPYRNYGFSDQWDAFELKEGWNHLVFQFDTTTRPEKTRFKFGLPKGVERAVTSATAPPAGSAPSGALARPHVNEYLVLGPFPAQKDLGTYVRLAGNVDPNTVAMDQASRLSSTLIAVRADFVHIRGFEIRHGAQYQQRAQADLHGEGIVFEGNLVRDSEVAGISFTADKDQRAAPIIIRNNWILNPGNIGIGGVSTSEKLTAANQSDLASGRSPVLIEHNTIVNSNWAGFPPGWAAGAMKLFKLTGAVIRYNTVIGGSGPGIWLDWEHYGNRIEGNLFRDVFGYGVGIEASPGPNLVANNVSVGLRPGWEWFRAAILSWDSDRTWAVNNSIDNRRNTGRSGNEATVGIELGQGGNRVIRWRPLANPQQVYANNVIVGSTTAIRARSHDVDAGNVVEPQERTKQRSDHDEVVALATRSLQKAAVAGAHSGAVAYDFFGLLRFTDQPQTVGAFRAEPAPKGRPTSLIEVEFSNGERQRLYETLP